jgi:hypothetical protein
MANTSSPGLRLQSRKKMQSAQGGIEMMAYEKVPMDGPRVTPGAAPIMDDETRMLL